MCNWDLRQARCFWGGVRLWLLERARQRTGTSSTMAREVCVSSQSTAFMKRPLRGVLGDAGPKAQARLPLPGCLAHAGLAQIQGAGSLALPRVDLSGSRVLARPLLGSRKVCRVIWMEPGPSAADLRKSQPASSL